MRHVLVLFFFMALSLLAKAQCEDSLSFAVTNPPCYQDFIPVCGCDDVTYVNFCHWQYAALNFYTEGPCEQVAFNFYPNPVVEYINLRIATKYESDVNLYIFDRNGNIMYYDYLSRMVNEQLIIPMYGFRQGIYFILAETNGETFSRKFVKWEL